MAVAGRNQRGSGDHQLLHPHLGFPESTAKVLMSLCTDEGRPSMRITLSDATASGEETARLLLDDVPERVRLGELIRLRVREEVARYNASPVPFFSGLVQPDDSERLARGYLLRVPRTLDWRAQADAALRAFARNGFFVLVGDRQVDDLDEELTLAELDVVSFVRLVPLVGG